MTLTTHAIVGVAAASFFPAHPYAAFAAGFTSHFIIDALPHWDYALDDGIENGRLTARDFVSVAADVLLGFVLTFFLAWFLQIPLWLALVGAGAGIYPDLITFLYFKLRLRLPRLAWAYEPISRFHNEYIQWWEWKGDNWKLGVGLQALLVIVILFLAWVI